MIALNENIKNQVRALSMVTYSMMFGLLLFMGISFLIVGTIPLEISDKKTASNISITLLIFSVCCAGMLDGVLRRKQDRIKESDYSSEEKIKKYSTAYIINLALLEAIGIIGIICFLLTGKPMALIGPFVSIILMFAHRPSEQKIMTLLG